MPRLAPGEDPKIDKINELVAIARSGDVSGESLKTLLEMFHPMILRICKRWSIYFEDYEHSLMPFEILVADAQYWFIEYTLHTYDPNGPATYNKFIKDHIMQRIRYIYECELKYAKRHIFPDPDKNANVPDNDKHDMLEDVIYRYAKVDNDSVTMDEGLIDKQDAKTKATLAAAILYLLSDRRYFNQREERIFTECECNGIAHEAMGKQLGISRTRVTQILARTKEKLMDRMSADVGIRRLVIKWRA